MYCLEAVFLSPAGLHAGSARQFVEAARKYPCQVTLRFRARSHDAKSMISILQAGVKYGDRIEVCCDGEREREACEKMVELAQSDLDQRQREFLWRGKEAL